jgi:glycerate dehydrogenase
MMHRVVWLDRASVPARVRRPRCAESYTEHERTGPGEVVPRLAGATVAITNKVPLREAALRLLPELRLIAVAATGYDVVDIAYCSAHGIAVCNIRNYAAHTVPEHVIALALALKRNILAYRHDVEAGLWQKANQFCLMDHPIADLHGSTLGIVGAGVIGRGTAALGRAFGMRVIYAAHGAATAGDPESVPLPKLLREADVISLHCPLNAETRGFIGEAELRSMKPTAVLINTARGGLVDEAALARALKEGWIGGAGFDVLSQEPPASGNVLLDLRLPNFILTPHNAWASAEATQALANQLSDNIDAWAEGAPRNLVT